MEQHSASYYRTRTAVRFTFGLTVWMTVILGSHWLVSALVPGASM